MFNHGSREAVQSDRNLPSTAVFSEIAQSCMWYSKLCTASPCLDCSRLSPRTAMQLPLSKTPLPTATRDAAQCLEDGQCLPCDIPGCQEKAAGVPKQLHLHHLFREKSGMWACASTPVANTAASRKAGSAQSPKLPLASRVPRRTSRPSPAHMQDSMIARTGGSMKLEAPPRTSGSELVAPLQEALAHPLFPVSPASSRSTGFGWHWQNGFLGLFAGCPEKVGPSSGQAAKPAHVLQRLSGGSSHCSAPLPTRNFWLLYPSPEDAPDDTVRSLGAAFRFQDLYYIPPGEWASMPHAWPAHLSGAQYAYRTQCHHSVCCAGPLISAVLVQHLHQRSLLVGDQQSLDSKRLGAARILDVVPKRAVSRLSCSLKSEASNMQNRSVVSNCGVFASLYGVAAKSNSRTYAKLPQAHRQYSFPAESHPHLFAKSSFASGHATTTLHAEMTKVDAESCTSKAK